MLAAPFWVDQGRQPEPSCAGGDRIDAFQTKEVVDCMVHDSGLKLTELRVDGARPPTTCSVSFKLTSSTSDQAAEGSRKYSLGVAYLAGLAVGYWKNREEISANWSVGGNFFHDV